MSLKRPRDNDVEIPPAKRVSTSTRPNLTIKIPKGSNGILRRWREESLREVPLVSPGQCYKVVFCPTTVNRTQDGRTYVKPMKQYDGPASWKINLVDMIIKLIEREAITVEGISYEDRLMMIIRLLELIYDLLQVEDRTTMIPIMDDGSSSWKISKDHLQYISLLYTNLVDCM